MKSRVEQGNKFSENRFGQANDKKFYFRLTFKFGQGKQKEKTKEDREFPKNRFGLMLSRQTNIRKEVLF